MGKFRSVEVILALIARSKGLTLKVKFWGIVLLSRRDKEEREREGEREKEREREGGRKGRGKEKEREKSERIGKK